MPFDREKEEAKLAEIFGHPKPPAVITEKQFDDFQKELAEVAKKPWSALTNHDWFYYGLDLSYSELQQDLFDWLFPGFVVLWRRGLAERQNLPQSEPDFYAPLLKGRVFERMMDEARRSEVFHYMANAFLEEVETITPEENVAENRRNEDLAYFLWVFNAIGQSVPITERLIDGLSGPMTPGKARYWITLAAGLFYPEQQVPWVSPWTKTGGGGGIYLLESWASIFDSGFLRENWSAYASWITIDVVRSRLEEAQEIDMQPYEQEQLHKLLVRSHEHRGFAERKLEWVVQNLTEPDLGGVMKEPDFTDSVEFYDG